MATTHVLAVELTNWQSVCLFVDAERAYTNIEAGDNQSGYNREDNWAHHERRMSIQDQIETLIISNGWAPPYLKFDDIRSEMSPSQMHKYGALIERYIHKYNVQINAMNLPSKHCMPKKPKFDDIVSLSNFVNRSSPRSVKEMLMTLDDGSLKQLLQNSMLFYLENGKFRKYLTKNRNESRFHYRILNSVQDSMVNNARGRTMYYEKHIFNKIPKYIVAGIFSFNDAITSLNASKACHSLYRASKEPSARSELRISAKWLSYEPCLSLKLLKQCKYIKKLSIYELNYNCNTAVFRRIFKELMLSCRTLKTIALNNTTGGLARRCLEVLSETDYGVTSIVYTDDCADRLQIPWPLLKRVRSVSAKEVPIETIYYPQLPRAVRYVPRLWLRNAPDFASSNFRNATSISRFLQSPFVVNLKHLELCNMLSTTESHPTAHPVFWLWQIGTLISAKLGIRLSKEHSFRGECQQMLRFPQMKQTAKEQVSFTSLILDFLSSEDVPDWNSIFTNIRLMYPNLANINYENTQPRDMWRHYLRPRSQQSLKISQSVDSSIAFGDLRSIDLNIPLDIGAATSLLMDITANELRFTGFVFLSIDIYISSESIYKMYGTPSIPFESNTLCRRQIMQNDVQNLIGNKHVLK